MALKRRKNIHVTKDGSVWVVRKEGAPRASALLDTQKDAYKAARKIALNQGYSVIVHGPDGRIQKKVSPREIEDESCFLTTACVKYYNLKDNCFQLQTLRTFRDSYLKSSQKGKSLILQYYSIAPQLVKKIERDKNKKIIYRNIFFEINKSCDLIMNKDNQSAIRVYSNVVKYLIAYYKYSI